MEKDILNKTHFQWIKFVSDLGGLMSQNHDHFMSVTLNACFYGIFDDAGYFPRKKQFVCLSHPAGTTCSQNDD